jgi:hypothetical protein
MNASPLPATAATECRPAARSAWQDASPLSSHQTNPASSVGNINTKGTYDNLG